MSDLIEGMGTAAEGGLFSRALEPESGARRPHPDQPEKCLNCGTPLTGAYCHACGQMGHVHRTIGAFMHDLLHGALHFEGKLWRTLPMLTFKPGKLTRRYIEGQRSRFVSPMALFLFTVFLMFAVFQMVGFTAPTDLSSTELPESSLDGARTTASDELANLRQQLEDGDLSTAERNEVIAEIRVLETFINGAPNATPSEAPTGTPDNGDEQLSGEEPTDTVGAPTVQMGLDQLADNSTGVDWLDTVIGKWRENPSLMVYKLQANAYKFSWLLIPISIPFVWLLFFWKRRFRGYDHAIFVTYSLSFMTLLFIVASILGRVGVSGGLVIAGLLIIPPIHLYKQLRGAYELSRFSAFWRLLVMSAFIWIIVGLFVQVLLWLGTF
ncbi:DUF3667 domain-containing protein [Aurantiacibacter sp. MUD11]|uniref:DUF3667 domain-containing protein n=1 Tax=Aurantiacibacter sp. MUD11 TaxID=3003265 RepID=UPI0022AA629C|nr:DUF3667 domain-containing protein [Aurantiacibacter sp. MUD11]WAT16812.1 DUF3667 domain-containing protein [Aurantiacibacter sp. MUD11]